MAAQCEAALAYARRGMPTFPVRPGAKRPLISSPHPENSPERLSCRGECGQDGHGCWDGTVDLDRVRAWWGHWPNANIGVRTGERFDVLDLDGPQGIEAMAAFAAEHGFSLDRVPCVPTPGGGRHYYFAPTGLGNAAGLLEHVDWRGRGGYVVAGPSIHPNGKPYAEVPEGADRPPWVPVPLRALLEPPKVSPAPARPTFRPGDTTTRYARAALEGTQSRILAATPRTRNDTAFREGRKLFQLVAGGVVSDAEAQTMLADAMRAVGLSPREIPGTIASARRRGMARPRGIPADPTPPPKVPAPGVQLSEDAFNAWTNGKPQVAPSGHPEPAVFPSRRSLEVYRYLEYRSHHDIQRRRVCEGASYEKLMGAFAVSKKTVQRDLAELIGRGYITPEKAPNHQQADGTWRRGGPNRYLLRLDPAAVRIAIVQESQGVSYARTEWSRSQVDVQVPPSGHGLPMTTENQVEASMHQEASTTEGLLPPQDGEAATLEPWPTDDAGNLVPVKLHVPEVDRLDHQPTARVVLDTIRGGLGEVRVLGAVRHDDPDAAAKLEAIQAGSAPLPAGWSWPARWQAEPTGACTRCGGEANTTGPDGRPWHPFCWAAAGKPPRHPAYQTGTRLRPRVLALAGSLDDFRRAIDRLDRDTCLEGPCRPGAPCRRHVRRRRAER
jgi:hypothetical protein